MVVDGSADRKTNGQGESYTPVQTLFAEGIKRKGISFNAKRLYELFTFHCELAYSV